MGVLSHRFSRPFLLRIGLTTMALGVGATLMRPLPVVIAGIGLVTIGFFASHSVASSWVGLRAREGKAQASALYLFFYYMGASTAGTIGGFFWTACLERRRGVPDRASRGGAADCRAVAPTRCLATKAQRRSATKHTEIERRNHKGLEDFFEILCDLKEIFVCFVATYRLVAFVTRGVT